MRRHSRARHDRRLDRTVSAVRTTDDAPPSTPVTGAPGSPQPIGNDDAPTRRPAEPLQFARKRPELGVALLSGLFATLAGLRPTGNAVVDTVVVATAALAVTWVAASAPWWSLVGAAALAAALAPTWPLILVAVAALTIYDMCKAIDRGMRIEGLRLVRKSGGKSGTITLE